jgi:hypothetical protein
MKDLGCHRERSEAIRELQGIASLPLAMTVLFYS